MKILSVAEKPSVAKELAKIIADAHNQQPFRRNGRSPYNHIFDINTCRFRGQECSMSMTSVTGHLMETDFDPRYKSWSSCQPADLFEAPLHKSVKKENEPIQQSLQEEAKKCNVLLLWLDCDLEGENISFEVISVCKAANPRLEVWRARFSALIPRDIMRTMTHPERPNDFFNDAVDARQEIDLRLGAAFTRFQTLRLQSKFPAVATNTVVSYGPCQFPTLGFIVERHLAIEAFRPENYWSMTCDFVHTDSDNTSCTVSFTWDRGHVFDHQVACILFDACVSASGGLEQCSAEVFKCDARKTHRQRPAPLNTVELQKRCSNFLRMSSDRTMQVAESLYQRGILSYPRTETDFFKEGFDLASIISEHVHHSEWGRYVTGLMEPGTGGYSRKFLWPRNGGHDDQAHPPIHPTRCVERNELENEDERRLYDLVSRHFFACCSRDGVGDQTNITICIPPRGLPGVQSEFFSTTGLMILERNWLDVYGTYEKWSTHTVPTLRVGDIFKPRSVVMTAGHTTAPLPLSESDLISEMDRHGIGTDATIATHIATVQQRAYAQKDASNRFQPTKLGLALIEAYNSMGYKLNRPYLRAAMEKDCQRIARGELRKTDMVRTCLTQMRDCFLRCSSEATKLDASIRKHFSAEETDNDANYVVAQARLSTCGRCGCKMDLRTRSENDTLVSRQLHCSTCKESHALPLKHDLSAIEHTCPLCQFQVLSVHNAETGKDHNLCPYCFKNPPPAPHSDEGQGIGEFRCFSCANSACSLSGRIQGEGIPISTCPGANCRDFIKLKRTSKGFVALCGSCDFKWWVPRFIKSVHPLQTTCSECTRQSGCDVHKLHIAVYANQVPLTIAPELDVCPCCHSIWLETRVNPLPLSRRPAGNAAPAHQVNISAPMASSSDYGAAAAGNVDVTNRRGASGGRGNARNDWSLSSSSSAPPTAAGRGGRGRGGRGGTGGGSSRQPQAAGEDPCCQCGIPASTGVTQKEGVNKGRRFFGCANKRGGQGGCNFFQWIDENTIPNAPNSNIAVAASVTCSKCNQLGHYARSCPNR